MTSYKRSRLTKREELKSLRRAYLFGGSTILLLLALIFLGLPLLINLATFLGELKSSSQVIKIDDTISPPSPQIYSLPKATKEAKIKLEGSSEANTKIIVFLNGRTAKETVVDQKGSFSVQINLVGEKNEITVQAEDQAGNKSQESEKIIIFFDQKPPEIEIFSPEQEELTWQESQIEIKGKTEEESKVFVNDRLVITDQEGNFDQVVSLSEGENIIKITAQDEAQNETTKEIKITYSPF